MLYLVHAFSQVRKQYVARIKIVIATTYSEIMMWGWYYVCQYEEACKGCVAQWQSKSMACPPRKGCTSARGLKETCPGYLMYWTTWGVLTARPASKPKWHAVPSKQDTRYPMNNLGHLHSDKFNCPEVVPGAECWVSFENFKCRKKQCMYMRVAGPGNL